MQQNVFCWRLRLLKGPFVLPCKQGAKGESVFELTMPKKNSTIRLTGWCSNITARECSSTWEHNDLPLRPYEVLLTILVGWIPCLTGTAGEVAKASCLAQWHENPRRNTPISAHWSAVFVSGENMGKATQRQNESYHLQSSWSQLVVKAVRDLDPLWSHW